MCTLPKVSHPNFTTLPFWAIMYLQGTIRIWNVIYKFIMVQIRSVVWNVNVGKQIVIGFHSLIERGEKTQILFFQVKLRASSICTPFTVLKIFKSDIVILKYWGLNMRFSTCSIYFGWSMECFSNNSWLLGEFNQVSKLIKQKGISTQIWLVILTKASSLLHWGDYKSKYLLLQAKLVEGRQGLLTKK